MSKKIILIGIFFIIVFSSTGCAFDQSQTTGFSEDEWWFEDGTDRDYAFKFYNQKAYKGGYDSVNFLNMYRGDENSIIQDVDQKEYDSDSAGLLYYYLFNDLAVVRGEKLTFPSVKYLKGTVLKHTKNKLVIKWTASLKNGKEKDAWTSHPITYIRVDEDGNTIR
ncbi:hypothetical protein HCC36_06675 [Listeria booriae]|uniref:Lipoprotein n=1 Tax=Listeria booriae TaxID=1552123 RepID=A0A842FVU9_9LIST|nr:hypothetical protein [Listeria booriae]MBC2292915.1 hypothetical protein [Listeria booriae]